MEKNIALDDIYLEHESALQVNTWFDDGNTQKREAIRTQLSKTHSCHYIYWVIE